MRIKKIKLAGFKSFVDPTTIPISDNLIGVVGPNGCGKSNVIDAVRWVMGESSASRLRGESMADVIFSGSTARKPVGKATVEIVFDNTDGRAPGQYAAYAELAIRREASRDGQSDYYINKTKCRRKDITDIFLGTGLGPRAYSIIEQGMVTRIIEAKPEDLRAFFEEAAGISKYKERRRETENRIKHARENLSRVEDIRKELETQLGRLQRQSKAANKYKEYKQQERLLRAQILALRWQALSAGIQEHDTALSAHETDLEAVIAGQREIEAAIEQIRSGQIEATDTFNTVQAQFYSIGAEINILEQAIQHARESRQQRVREQEQLERAWQEANRHLETDKEQIARLRANLDNAAPQYETARAMRVSAAAALADAERSMQEWQAQWEQYTPRAAEPAKRRDIQQARVQQLEQHLAQARTRHGRLADESRDLETKLKDQGIDELRRSVAARDRSCETHAQRLEQVEAEIRGAQEQVRALNTAIGEVRGRGHNARARETSLRELQAAALGKYDEALNAWLAQRGLRDAPRLAKLVKVEPGWEKAVERVLGMDLGAVCAQGLDDLATELAQLATSDAVFYDTTAHGDAAPKSTRACLTDKLQSQVDLSGVLWGVYLAESLSEALALRAELAPHESVVTREGVWLGKNWMALPETKGARAGMLARERDLENLAREIAAAADEIAAQEAQLAALQQRVQALESERAELRRQLNDDQRERANLREQFGHKEAQLNQMAARHQQLDIERNELTAQIERGEADIAAARAAIAQAEEEMRVLDDEKRALLQTRDQRKAALEAARADATAAGEALHRLEVERQATQTAFESTQQSIARLESQLKDLLARRAEIELALNSDERPEEELAKRLEAFLQKRVHIEQELAQARKAVGELDAALREREQARTAQEQKSSAVRQLLEQERMARQELIVRRDTVKEQVRESGHELEAVLQELPADMHEDACQAELDQLLARIERLGPINLVAISEYEEQSQRKSYLDKQNEDLSQALATLEDAIRKIDRETRTRFKETFDKVNTGFQTIFPRLFGGGHAYLELNDDDLLNTGVSVMARPPGKRNSTIHLLSGGEKALTAVSLLFAIFELNPAPFCLLDEVDAPLDDANVERYAQTLKAMSQHTQLLFITHNKITMEIANVLLGVTMSEPGVSRLVAVDVEEALEMVAQ